MKSYVLNTHDQTCLHSIICKTYFITSASVFERKAYCLSIYLCRDTSSCRNNLAPAVSLAVKKGSLKCVALAFYPNCFDVSFPSLSDFSNG
ncbi:CLUMA_CG001649, isoform A [Clunio marinus]|uniref:CLUMA_CG001649, isoform A n=1 Tax=Clunio marinus TaxID=568069 RepID=A0A1J1HN19_9DIPT|nr:CLUMA_CG001649, isoform A [Clunio marinus]